MHIKTNKKGQRYAILSRSERGRLAYDNLQRMKTQRYLEAEEVRIKLNQYGVQ